MDPGTANLTDCIELSPLGSLLVESRDRIFQLWERAVRRHIFQFRAVDFPILMDAFPSFITSLAEAVTPSNPRKTPSALSTIAQEHGGERARIATYGAENIVQEYQLLRLTIFDVLVERGVSLGHQESRAMNLFIDEAVKEAVVGFGIIQNAQREKFVATLTHDLIPIIFSS